VPQWSVVGWLYFTFNLCGPVLNIIETSDIHAPQMKWSPVRFCFTNSCLTYFPFVSILLFICREHQGPKLAHLQAKLMKEKQAKGKVSVVHYVTGAHCLLCKFIILTRLLLCCLHSICTTNWRHCVSGTHFFRLKQKRKLPQVKLQLQTQLLLCHSKTAIWANRAHLSRWFQM
jgi:hypothetical protein